MFYNGQGLKDRKNIKSQNTDFRVICIHIIMLKYKIFNLERKGLDQDVVLKQTVLLSSSTCNDIREMQISYKERFKKLYEEKTLAMG